MRPQWQKTSFAIGANKANRAYESLGEWILAAKTLAQAVSAYGASLKSKLANVAISGAPEDQLRSPLEALIRDLAEIEGMSPNAVKLVGETTLAELKTRPDFAVTVGNALVGFIEVKAPGKGADPRQFSDPHDKEQWDKLKSLPNLIYTDGQSFSLWRDGKSESGIVRLTGNIESSGAKLEAPATLLPLVVDFLQWQPIAPKTAKQLAQVSARLCRLLRDEVIEQMGLGSPALTGLAHDWRALLFPQADDAQFADGYAQAVTFGLLVARARDISLSGGTEMAAQELKKSNSLIGTALRLLTEDTSNQEALKTSLGTLTRVLGVVNWHTITKDDPKEWLYFYEQFLEVYDNALRKRTGSYYTPPEVVSAMVNMVDEALRGPLFERSAGFAAADVIVADPAVGTGTFLLGVLRADRGDGQKRPRRRRGARRHRSGGQAPHRFRNSVRSVCRRATTADRGNADADEQAATAGASFVHHRYARQSIHRRGETRTDLRADRGVAARREQGEERRTHHGRHR